MIAAVLDRAISPRLRSLVERFRNKEYRDSYIIGHTRSFLARQMRTFRGQRSQEEFGQIIGKQQTVVSRLEDPNYGKWTLQTLFDVAARLNVAVIVRFVDVPTFLRLTEDMSEAAYDPQPCTDEQLEEAARPSIKRISIKPLDGKEPIQVYDASSEDELVEIGSTTTDSDRSTDSNRSYVQ